MTYEPLELEGLRATSEVAAIILGEPLLWASLLGGGVILVGVWMVNRPRRVRHLT